MSYIRSTSTFGLRKLAASDRDFYIGLYTSGPLTRLIKASLTKNEALKSFNNSLKFTHQPNPKYQVFIAVQQSSHSLMGIMGLTNICYIKRTAEIGIILSRQFHGKNHPITMTELTLDYAFKELQLKRVYADFDVKNLAVARLVRRLGFCFEADKSDANTKFYSITP